MRSIYIMIVAGICIIALAYWGISLIGGAYGGSPLATVGIAANENDHPLSACYPVGKSLAITGHIDNWASKAVSRSGGLKEQHYLKFADGAVCSVRPAERNLEIIAMHRGNSPGKVADFKGGYKKI